MEHSDPCESEVGELSSLRIRFIQTIPYPEDTAHVVRYTLDLDCAGSAEIRPITGDRNGEDIDIAVNASNSMLRAQEPFEGQRKSEPPGHVHAEA